MASMKLLVLALFAVSMVNAGNSYLKARCPEGDNGPCSQPESLEGVPLIHGDDYDVPLYDVPEVSWVYPKVGGRSNVWSAHGNQFIFNTGGTAAASNWPQSFTKIYETVKYSENSLEVYLNDGQESRYIFGPWSSMNHSRTFHVAEYFNEQLFVFGGGSNTVERLTFDSFFWAEDIDRAETQYAGNYQSIGTWEVVPTTGSAPEDLYGAAYERFGNLLFVFGGLTAQGIISDKFYSFNLVTYEWTEITASGSPSARFGSSLNYYDGNLYLFGGRTSATVSTNQFYKYNMMLGTWVEITTMVEELRATAFHASFVDDNTLVIILGEGTNETRAEQSRWRDFYVFDFEEEDWFVVDVPASSVAPSVRSGFSFVVGFEFVLFGGVRNTGMPYLDGGSDAVNAAVWVLDLASYKWHLRACNPGYIWVASTAVCAPVWDFTCYECEDCADFSEHRMEYVSDIRSNTELKDFSGALRQCPAVWRGK